MVRSSTMATVHEVTTCCHRRLKRVIHNIPDNSLTNPTKHRISCQSPPVTFRTSEPPVSSNRRFLENFCDGRQSPSINRRTTTDFVPRIFPTSSSRVHPHLATRYSAFEHSVSCSVGTLLFPELSPHCPHTLTSFPQRLTCSFVTHQNPNTHQSLNQKYRTHLQTYAHNHADGTDVVDATNAINDLHL